MVPVPMGCNVSAKNIMKNNHSSVSEIKTTRAERVWLQLAAEIVSGGVRSGLRLDEVEQAQRLGVSRTPLRESLRQLAALGLVENRPHRGAVVADGVGGSLFEVLADLEAECAREAAERLDDGQRAQLAGLAADEARAMALIRRHCANSVRRGLLRTLWHPLQGALDDGKMVTSAATALAAARLVRAVVDGDGDGAGRAARDYVTAWRDLVLGGEVTVAAT